MDLDARSATTEVDTYLQDYDFESSQSGTLAGNVYADALRKAQQEVAHLGEKPDRYDTWAARKSEHLKSVRASLSGDKSEKLKAEAWAVRMLLNQHGFEIRRETQRKLEVVLRDILPTDESR